MQRAWLKIRSFILTPLTRVIISGIFLAIMAGLFWFEKISSAHPEPTITMAMLAVMVLIVGLAINNLRATNKALSQQADTLRSNNSKLAHKAGILRATNRALLQEMDVLQAQINDIPQEIMEGQPRLMGLELLVERWQTFEPKQGESAILHEQFSIAQSIAQLKYSHADEVHFINYFSGFKIESGAFLIQPGHQMPLVLKFDSMANIRAETERYEQCVAGQLGLTPGGPLVPPQRPGKIAGEEWGAITYNLVRADQAELGRLQTFADYYATCHRSQQIASALNEIFATLRPWWQNPTWPANCAQGRRNTLYGEYDRLTRKGDQIEQGIVEAGQKMQLEVLQNITISQTHLNLDPDLRLRNPLNWVNGVFQTRQLNGWLNQLRRDSVVHGDLHAGNILITQDSHGQLRAWVIDFPHTHVGPTIQDIARLEADVKFGLLASVTLQALSIHEIYRLETTFLPKYEQPVPSLADLTPDQLPAKQLTNPHWQKAWQAVYLLRNEARKYMNGYDARPYYLALLHATMPALYYRNRDPWQKLYTFISAALLCERLDDESRQ